MGYTPFKMEGPSLYSKAKKHAEKGLEASKGKDIKFGIKETRDGVEYIDSILQRSPGKKMGYGVSGKESFDEMFSKAKKHGEKEFTWKGKKYHTKTKDEVQKATKDAQTTGEYKDKKNKLIKGK